MTERQEAASPGRRERILGLLEQPDGRVDTARLGRVCQQATGVTGAGLMLMSPDMPGVSVATTDEVSTLIEDLQFELGEGPCIDAYQQNRPVLEPDLADPLVMRWMAFGPLVLAAGGRAVFGFPLHVGAARLGALNLYCDTAGSLSADQHADALVMATIAAEALLLMQSNAPVGLLAAELASNVNFHHVVHQASGMVAVQLNVSLAQALIRLRGHAFGNGQPLNEIANDVVSRRLRFAPDEHPDQHPEQQGS